MISNDNKYTTMQKEAYEGGTTNHDEHNTNPDYWNILLGDLKDKEKWDNKIALDFACGRGRNVTNIMSMCDWARVDGIDISGANIYQNKNDYQTQKSNWYCNNGVDVSELKNDEYDFIMSTIALQHIPVYDIRKSLITDLYRTLKSGGVFSFQMGYGSGLESELGQRVSYFENHYDAPGTNSVCDVRIQNEEEVIKDLESIGFIDIKTEVRESYSDSGHPQWIYIKCYKK